MSVRRFVVTAVIASLCIGALPRSTRASDEPITPRTTPIATDGQPETALRIALERAASKLAADSTTATPRQPERAAMMQYAGGAGGGSHFTMIISLVSTVVGLGAMYYVVKQMQKNSEAANK